MLRIRSMISPAEGKALAGELICSNSSLRIQQGGMNSCFSADPTVISHKRWFHLSAGWFAAVFAAIVCTFQQYGMSWDEHFLQPYADKLLDYYSSWFADRSAFDIFNSYLYGAALEMVTALFGRLLPFDVFDTRHLGSALTGLLGIIGAWKAAGLLGGPRAGFFAAVLLALVPGYYGHMFINPKDIPFAAGYIWSLYYLLLLFDEYPRVSLKLGAKLGLSIGLTVAVRVAGVLLGCYLGAALALLLFLSIFRERNLRTPLRDLCRTAPALGIAVLVAVPLVLVLWPWVARDPLHHLLQALREFSYFKDAQTGSTLFLGQDVRLASLPWTYIPVYLALKLPEAVLLGLLCFVVLVPKLAVRRESGRPLQMRLFIKLAFIVFCTAFPPLYVVIRHSIIYDEIRQLLFIIPPLVCCAALGWEALLLSLSDRPKPRRVVLTAFAALAAAQVWVMMSLHPYQYAYFNAISGGTRAAQAAFDLDYWGVSQREAVELLKAELQRRYPDFKRRRFRVAAGKPVWTASHYYPPQFLFAASPADAQFYISTLRYGQDRNVDWPVMLQVTRRGAVLSVVKERPAGP